LVLLAGVAPADPQQRGGQFNSGGTYGNAYREEPYARVGARRPLDGTPRRGSPRPVAYAPPPRPSIWQGIYLGAHGGYSFASATPSQSFDTVDMSGGAAGGHMGVNLQSGNLVIGLEADGTWHDASGSRSFAGPAYVDAFADWTASFRGRLGYAFGNVLVYATGGAALGGFDIGVASGGTASRMSDTVLGYAVGGGLEMEFSPEWSGRIEALHYGFSEKTFQFATGSVPVDLGVTTVRAGLTFHFR
jgi:outer membrane immunogenic protein